MSVQKKHWMFYVVYMCAETCQNKAPPDIWMESGISSAYLQSWQLVHIGTQLLNGVVRSYHGAEQIQPLWVEVIGEGGDVILGDVDGRELGALAQPFRQSLQAVAAHIQRVELRQQSDLLRQNPEVVNREVQDLHGAQTTDGSRDGGKLIPAKDEALEVCQMFDVVVDLCQARTLADFQIIQQCEGIDGRVESSIRGNSLVDRCAL